MNLWNAKECMLICTICNWVNKKKYFLKKYIISFIEDIWSRKSIFVLFLLPFSIIYLCINKFIYFLYKIGYKKIKKFKVPIIVIGNITVGGNGKTPLVIWLSDQLKKNWKVGVVSRGYGRKYKKTPVIINKNTTCEECGDEPAMIYDKSNVPVAVSSNRIEAINMLLKLYSLDVIISDDGLQHYSMGRSIEWITVDYNKKFGNNFLLPAGPMRETKNKLFSVENVILSGFCITYNKNIQARFYHKNFAINLVTNKKKTITFTAICCHGRN